MGELVPQDGAELSRGEAIGDRSVEDDVRLAGEVGERGVEGGRSLRLVEGDGRGEPELRRDLAGRGVERGVCVRVEPIGGLEELEPDRLRLLAAERLGGEPLPELGLLLLEVADHLQVVPERLDG